MKKILLLILLMGIAITKGDAQTSAIKQGLKGKVKSCKETVYDETVLSAVKKNTKRLNSFVSNFDERGNLTQKEMYNGSDVLVFRIEYEYKGGQLQKLTETYHELNTPVVITRELMSSTASQNVWKQVRNASGDIRSDTLYQVKSDGGRTLVIQDKDGRIINMEKYNEDGLLNEYKQVSDAHAKYSIWFINTFDYRKLIVETEFLKPFSPVHEEQSKIFYRYFMFDDQKNWVMRTNIENGSVINITKREIEYYK
ncbi:hypothetical protein M2451_000443 [Dysgonomonas sp. PFB1-18]|uniref:hypothetical protein n=1 Tax=unclassified Dysgonomonas TaxID=2630389 RepID=UPI002476B444|nr:MULTISPECIES: hypothetical protein [unclassified Dysgonomonas]MDH6307294.1 hypothetical protein [Dysgonomonas sp. PF1-14]MDH6337212.1 hypothetical protein [Dysgonomonas sp. PF1-16]MDH6379136.1 hypothetical protein [Dysgonomonas sp. PFB1-18]MDH6396226.1 hypothetical protein [Dysgonomonas sp. PF1-23]